MEYTLEYIRHKKMLWLEAEEKVAFGQSYTIDGQTVTRADLSKIAERISYWSRKEAEYLNGGSGWRIMQAVPN